MVYGRERREIGPPTRRPGLLQGGWPVPSHNPRRHLRGPRQHHPRLDVLGPGRREPDGCRGWVLRSAKADVERIAQQSALNPLGAYDQALLEGGDRRACLQGQQVPPPNSPRYPTVRWPHLEGLYYHVVVSPALRVPERYSISPT